jgi:GTP-binding protein HflX
LLERPQTGERAVLVHMDLTGRDSAEELAEFKELVISVGIEPAAIITGSLHTIIAPYFIGSGKADEIKQQVDLTKAQVVIFNHTLSPAQERNLERHCQARVVDRTGLILDVFARRARSHEGKLQVELAQLTHMATRLVRGWTHLERQKGGIGLRGPGETQLETDRRLLRMRVKTINERLQKTHSQRELRRTARAKAAIPTVCLVGYTNAGKSSLFNTLTHSDTYVAPKLFATLDPSYRRLELPQFGPAILIDTVGFIRNLPHTLIDAFHATLEETREATILLHVTDVSSDHHHVCEEQVQAVLNEIKASDVPQLEVYNKIDLLPGVRPHVDRNEDGIIKRVWISAATDQGLELLRQAIAERLSTDVYFGEVCVFVQYPHTRAALYAQQAVLHERIDDQGHYHLLIRCPQKELNKLFAEK